MVGSSGKRPRGISPQNLPSIVGSPFPQASHAHIIPIRDSYGSGMGLGSLITLAINVPKSIFEEDQQNEIFPKRQNLGVGFTYFSFHPENWGRKSPNLTFTHFSKWVETQPPTRNILCLVPPDTCFVGSGGCKAPSLRS